MSEFHVHLKCRRASDAELLADLRRVAAQAGAVVLLRGDYNRLGRFSDVTLRNRFGGWPQALQAAGLPSRPRREVSDEALFENLAAVWRALDRQPVLDDLHRARGFSRFDTSIYPRRFGSWNAALLRFQAWLDGSDWRSGALGDLRSEAWGNVVGGSSKPPPRAAAVPSLAVAGEGAQRQGRQTASAGGVRRGKMRTPSWRLRARILLRDRSTCQLCGASPAKDPRTVLHVDHIVPWSKGGPTTEANLRTLCQACNLGLGNGGNGELLGEPQINTDGH